MIVLEKLKCITFLFIHKYCHFFDDCCSLADKINTEVVKSPAEIKLDFEL